ncbi:MAG: anaerobic sulfite reductase subunit AsrB [Candidatus Rifleibacteriota bacterium]
MKENPYRPLAAEIIELRRETSAEFTIKVKAEAEICPGQFFQVSLPKIGEAPISVSSFGPDYIEFTIRAVGTLTNVLHDYRVGDRIFIRGPYGRGFPVEKFRDKDLLIVAGGSGLAPVRPLIQKSLSGELGIRSLKLIIGFKNSEGILFSQQIEEWAKESDLLLTIDKPESGWIGKTGLVTEHIKKLPKDSLKNLEAVVVGPTMMMKFSTAELVLLGLKDEQIWVSFERLMSCGIGKCGHCKIDYTYVCVDGPVLNYSHAARLID